VVHSNGFRDDSWLDVGRGLLMDAAKVTRNSSARFQNLKIGTTVDDPKAYTARWTITLSLPLVVDTELLDYISLENERNSAHSVGR